jgi:tetratricopeptide (TPR) repeat protein
LWEALKANPREPRPVYLLSQLAIKGGAYQQAMTFLKQHLMLAGESKEVLLQLAQIQAEQELTQEASQSYAKLEQLYPEWTDGLFSYAGFLQSKGELEKVEPLLRKVIRLEPHHCGAFLALSNLIEFDASNQLIQQMEQLQQRVTRENKTLQQIQINYALGKVYDDLGLFDKAFQSWSNANKLQLDNCSFRVSQMKPFFKQLKTSFESINESGTNQTDVVKRQQITPIFIVGLPRTGSTLLEQMLNQHSEVGTIGESNAIASVIASSISKITNQSFPGGLDKITPQQWQLLGDRYLEHLRQKCADKTFVINKLPANFQTIGVIKKALPQAIIIHLTRTPQAVALSVLRNYFSANEPYFCDLQEFIDYRKLYLDVMTFWKGYFGDSIIELNYEQLILEQEATLRRVLQACDLPWQTRCLEFSNAKSQVKTLSDTQVRRPLYRSSLDAWQNYRPYLSRLENE